MTTKVPQPPARGQRVQRDLKLVDRLRFTATAILRSSPSLSVSLPRMLESICETIGWDIAEMWRLDRDAMVVNCEALWHRPSIDAEQFKEITLAARIPLDATMPGRVVTTGQGVWITDVQTDQGFRRAAFAAKAGLRSGFAVPVRDGTTVMGVLAFLTRDIRERDERLLAAMSEIGQEIGCLVEGEWAISRDDRYFRSLAEALSDVLDVLELDGTIRYENPSVERVLGYSVGERIGKNVWDFLHPDDLAKAFDAFRAGIQSPGTFYTIEVRARHKDGSWRHFESIGSVQTDRSGSTVAIGSSRDITERKEAERLLEAQYRVLERIALGASLGDALDALVRLIEETSGEAFASVCLVNEEGTRLQIVARGSLSGAFVEGLKDGVPIGPRAGSCGTAAYRGEPVVTPDLANDPLWRDNREFMLSHGLRAVWSTPIMSTAGRVLGTLAMYYRAPHTPDDYERRLVQTATHIASIAIERSLTDRALAALAANLGEFDPGTQEYAYVVSHEGVRGSARRKPVRKDSPPQPPGRRLRRGQDIIGNLHLSAQDIRILGLVAQGLTNKRISVLLYLSPHTVKDYLSAAMRKLGAKNRAEAVIAATRLGLI